MLGSGFGKDLLVNNMFAQISIVGSSSLRQMCKQDLASMII